MRSITNPVAFLLTAALLPAGLTTTITAAAAEPPATPEAAIADQPRVRFDGHSIARFTIRTHAELHRVSDLLDDQWTHGHGIGEIDFRVPPEKMAAAEALGIPFAIVIEDVQELIDQERRRIDAGANAGPLAGGDGAGWAGPGVGGSDPFFDDYRPLDEIMTFTDAWVTDFPALVERTVIGQSLEGRDLIAYTLNGAGDAATKPAVCINALQHAREWIGPAATVWTINELLNGYGTDADVTALLDRVVVHVIPIVNPDGYVWTWDVNRLWRKNRRDNGDGTFGVDPNRNWSAGWGGPGSSGNGDSETFRGPKPFSEPETTALSNFILARPQITMHLDVHSFSQLVLSPFGNAEVEPDEPLGSRYRTMTRAMAEAFRLHAERLYTPQPAHDLYLASGVCTDWAHTEAGTFSWTYELRPRSSASGGFILPAIELIPAANELEDAVRVFLNAAAYGALWNAPDGLPITVDASTPDSFEVRLAVIDDVPLDPSLVMGFARDADDPGSAFTAVSLQTTDEDGVFDVTLPAGLCGTTLDVYFEFASGTDVVRFPADAPTALFQVDLAGDELILADSFENDMGWITSGDNLDDGQWERGIPAGDGERYDPITDADGNDWCFLTDNQLGNSDVDGGPAYLESPAFSLVGMNAPYAEVRLWMSDSVDLDRMTIECAVEDGPWTFLADKAGTIGWELVRLDLSNAAGAGEARLRFSVTDNPPASIVEAGVDAVRIYDATCPDVNADLNGDGIVGFADLSTLLAGWGPCPPGAPCFADINGSGVVDLADLIALLAAWD